MKWSGEFEHCWITSYASPALLEEAEELPSGYQVSALKDDMKPQQADLLHGQSGAVVGAVLLALRIPSELSI
jgi:hypothetical protein